MKTRLTAALSPEPILVEFPDADELAMLRTWYAGMPVRKAAERYLPRTVGILRAHRIATLADLTVRISRWRQRWKAVPGLGPASASKIEAFFAAHPALTERERPLIALSPASTVAPWEQLRLPQEVDGSAGAYRAPRATCTLDADNDYQAVHAWLSLHESAASSVRTARRPSGSSFGRLSNEDGHFRR